MTKIKPLSKATEERLIRLLSDVTDKATSGAEAEEELYKIAVQERLSPDHVRLLGRAYNTGLSLGHIKSSSSLKEKLSSVELVDPEAVVVRVYPNKVEKKADILHKTIVSPSYYVLPKNLRSRMLVFETTANFTKAAKTTKNKPKVSLQQKFASIQKLRKLKQDVKNIQEVLFSKMATALTQLQDYFNRPDSEDPTYVFDNAEVLLGKPVRVLKSRLNFKQVKHAAEKPVSLNRAPYNWISDFVEAARLYKQAQRRLEKIPNLDPKIRQKPDEPCTGDLAQQFDKIALFPSISDFNKKLDELLVDEKDPRAKLDQSLSYGDQDAKLYALAAKRTLSNLILNDPIISQYDPQQVEDAYKELLRIAPRAGITLNVAQAYLRKLLSQNGVLDTFELAQLKDLDKTFHSIIKTEEEYQN